MKHIFKTLAMLVFIAASASAETAIECNNQGYFIPGENKQVLGEGTYTRWDGVCRPASELNRNTNDWPYKIEDLGTSIRLTRKSKSITLPDPGWINYHYSFNKVSFDFQVNHLSTLVDRSTVFNQSCRYISMGDSDSWTTATGIRNGDFHWSEKLVIADSTTKTVYNEELDEDIVVNDPQIFDNTKAQFKIVNQKLYFLECDNPYFANAIYPITFSFHSYIINNTGGDSTWDSGTHTDTVVKKSTKVLQLEWLNTTQNTELYTYLTFDDGTGTLAKGEATYQMNATLDTDTYWDATGVYGGSISPGVGDEIFIPNQPLLNHNSPFTITWWMKTSDTEGCIFGRNNQATPGRYCFPSSGKSYEFGYLSNALYAQVDGSGGACFITINTDYNDGAWHHWTWALNGTHHIVYTDGQLNEANACASYPYDRSTALSIGGQEYDLTGNIDDFRVYNWSLSDEEINISMNNHHEESGNWTSASIDSGAGNICDNVSVDFTSNNQRVDLWFDDGDDDTYEVIQTSITTGTVYSLGGSSQTCKIRLSLIDTVALNVTPEINNLTMEFAEAAGDGPVVYGADICTGGDVDPDQTCDTLDITFNSQTPADIDVFSLFSQNLFINYSIVSGDTAINLNNTWTTVNTSSGCYIYGNGTCVFSGNISNLQTDLEQEGGNWVWEFDDNNVYPGSYNLPERQLEDTPQTIVNLTDRTQEASKIRLYNVQNTTPFGVFEVMVDPENANSAPLEVFYCNDQYTTGNFRTDGDCTQFGLITVDDWYNHTHTIYSNHSIVPFAVNITSGLINDQVAVTNESYFILSASVGPNGWNIYGVPNETRADQMQTTVTRGNTWTNLLGATYNAHLHQYQGGEAFCYFIEACNTALCENSTQRCDLLELGNLPPTTPDVYHPVELYYPLNDLLDINWTPATSPNSYPITSYNITVWNGSLLLEEILEDQLGGGLLNYSWDTTGYNEGIYFIGVSALDDQGQIGGFGFSENFTLETTTTTLTTTTTTVTTTVTTTTTTVTTTSTTATTTTSTTTVPGTTTTTTLPDINATATPNFALLVQGYPLQAAAGTYTSVWGGFFWPFIFLVLYIAVWIRTQNIVYPSIMLLGILSVFNLDQYIHPTVQNIFYALLIIVLTIQLIRSFGTNYTE